MTTQSSPVITDMKVIPVAGHDSMPVSYTHLRAHETAAY